MRKPELSRESPDRGKQMARMSACGICKNTSLGIRVSKSKFYFKMVCVSAGGICENTTLGMGVLKSKFEIKILIENLKFS